MTSVVKSDHLAVVAYAEGAPRVQTKTCVERTFRRKSPTQHALFLQHVSAVDIGDDLPSASTQSEFDNFYNMALGLLDEFYPQRTISITSRDPDWVTPETKAMLRRKNRLMRAGRVEEARALAYRISKEQTRRNRFRLSKAGRKTEAKDVWAAFRQLTGKRRESGPVEGVDAESLNQHYARISTDAAYSTPFSKSTASPGQQQYITEWQVFRVLDHLRHTATGLDRLPARFLRLGAPVRY